MSVLSEQWKPVVGLEGAYEVSDRGRVRSLPRQIKASSRWGGVRTLALGGGVKKLTTALTGYKVVGLHRSGSSLLAYVHHLVLEAFVGPCPPGMECRHLNGVRHDNRLENLAWGTPNDNAQDRILHGTTNAGKRYRTREYYEAKLAELERVKRERGTWGRVASHLGIASANAAALRACSLRRRLQNADYAGGVKSQS